ncbi:MAG TPA: hypothetical protein PKD53_15845 [Chloroflexaceae bacterium]|nr:hypothetical protein [Chloroflexaceae bacterium]
MRDLPLAPFLSALADDGFVVLPRDYQRIQLVLQTGGSWSIARLRDTLLALLARSPEAQERFLQRFEEFFGAGGPLPAGAPVDIARALTDLRALTAVGAPTPAGAPPLSRPPEPPTPPGARQQRETDVRPPLPRYAVWALLLGLAAAGALAVGLLLTRGREPPPAPSPPPFEVALGPGDFGVVAVGERATLPALTVTNALSEPQTLEVRLLDADPALSLSAEPLVLNLGPGGTGVVLVTFAPQRAGLGAGSISLSARASIRTVSLPAQAAGPALVPLTLVATTYDPAAPAAPVIFRRVYSRVPRVETTALVRRAPSDWLYYALGAAVVGSLGLLYGLWLLRRRSPAPETPPGWDDDGPRHFSLRPVGGPPEPMLDEETIGLVADSLGYVASEERGQSLNVSASISNTLRAGGLPRLAFLPRRQVRSLLILEDALSQAAWNTTPAELALGLVRRGVTVIHGRFEGSVAQFQTVDGAVHYLEDLEDRRSSFLVLLFTDGTGLSRACEDFSLEALAHWPMVAWMDLREPRAWGASGGFAGRYGLPAFTANARGVAQAVRRFSAEGAVAESDQALTTPAPDEAHGAGQAAYVERLLGDALPWAQACALFQPVSRGLAGALRRRFFQSLPPERIERLYALPGTKETVAGLYFAPEVQKVLREGFFARRGEADQRQVLAAILDELRRVEPAGGGLGHMAWELCCERVRLELDPDNDLDRLYQLAQTPLGPKIREDLAGFGFRDQPDKIPLRLRPRRREALLRLHKLAPHLRIPALEERPQLAVWQRAAVGALASLCLALAGMSLYRYQLDSAAGSDLLIEAPGGLLTHVGVYDPERGELPPYALRSVPPPGQVGMGSARSFYVTSEDLGAEQVRIAGSLPVGARELHLFGGGGWQTVELTRTSVFQPSVRVELQVAPATTEEACRETIGNLRVTIERCPASLQRQPAVPGSERRFARAELGSWHEAVVETGIRPGLIDRAGSIGVAVVARDRPGLAQLGDLLLTSRSVDAVYTVEADGQVPIELALDEIAARLGPAARHTQVIWWTDEGVTLAPSEVVARFGPQLRLGEDGAAPAAERLEEALRLTCCSSLLTGDTLLARLEDDGPAAKPPVDLPAATREPVAPNKDVWLIPLPNEVQHATGTVLLRAVPQGGEVRLTRPTGYSSEPWLSALTLSRSGTYEVPAGPWRAEARGGFGSVALAEITVQAGEVARLAMDTQPAAAATLVADELASEGNAGLVESLRLGAPVHGAAVSPASGSFALLTRDAVVVQQFSFWAESGAWMFGQSRLSFAGPTVATFSPDGLLLAIGGEDGLVTLYNVETVEQQGALRHDARITSLAFSPDGRQLLSASEDGTARRWTIGGAWEVYTHGVPVTLTRFSPDGARFATAGADGSVQVWGLEDPLTLSAHQLAVNDLEWSPDGRLLFTADTGGRAALWTMDSSGLRAEATQIIEDGFGGAFSPIGEMAAVSAGGGVSAWNLAGGAPSPLFLYPAGRVLHVEFSPDDPLLLTRADDRTARLWTMPDGTERGVMRHQAPLVHAGFAGPGRVLTVGEDGVVGLWVTTTDDLVFAGTLSEGSPLPLPTFNPTVIVPTMTATEAMQPGRLIVTSKGRGGREGCISVQIEGVSTAGWTLTLDRLLLRVPFDAQGAVAICRLEAVDEGVTVRDGGGSIVPGGDSIAARTGDIFTLEWRPSP